MKLSTLDSFTKNISKIISVIFFILAVVCLIGGGVSFVALSPSMVEKVREMIANGTITFTKGNAGLLIESAADIQKAAVLGCLKGCINCVLGGMIFRNIHRMLKNLETNHTPFTLENAKLIKNIGIYAIATQAVTFVIDLIAAILLVSGNVSVNIELTNLVFAFTVLCISRIFAYGVNLESDVEGLV